MKNLTPKTSGLNRVSTANEELVTGFPDNYTVKEYKVITFYSAQDCTLIWNNEVELPIMANAGLQLDERCKPIKSLIIKESGIPYYFHVLY